MSLNLSFFLILHQINWSMNFKHMINNRLIEVTIFKGEDVDKFV